MKNKALKANSAMLFAFDSCEIRAINKHGEAWFVAADVCEALGYANTSKAISDHLDDDERSTVTNSESRNGGGQLVIINESGLYALVLRSNKPEARKFAKWVTREVLPSIRKTGEYVDADLKARIAHLKSQNEALQIENEAIHDTLQSFGTSYEALHAVENSIIRNITKAPGEHKTVQLQKIVMAEVTCTEQDFWHAVTDLYNRYKIKQNEKSAWVLAR